MYHQQRWTLEKIKSRLKLIEPLIYKRSKPLPPFYYTELDNPLTKPDLNPDITGWTVIYHGENWGDWQTNFQMISTFRIPEEWKGEDPCILYLPLGGIEGDFSHPEALVYIDGNPYATVDRHHFEIFINPAWHDSHEHTLMLHGWTGLGITATGDPGIPLRMGIPQIVQIHSLTRDFFVLAGVTLSTIENLQDDNPSRSLLLNAVNEAFIKLDTSDPLGETFYDSVSPAYELLASGIKESGNPLDVKIHATGHAHIDVAWLWTLGQTRRKAERTFHNVIRNMERVPNFHFSQSQPQLYQFIEQDQPALFKDIQNMVADKRWEPMGGMWVEADCNITGAESLARQFLMGRTYFQEKFGKNADTQVLWLPDVFGYAWALPQLIQQAGLKYFMTIKIGWSQYNRLPYDTFLWQGIDGSKILTHFSTVKELESPYASTYNSMANPSEALGTWNNFQQKELHQDLLMAYGFGDGGGGPTLEMLENLEIMDNFPGLPQVKHSSVKEFFENIEPLTDSKMMPVWNGELYLEYHRGTYTTQAKTKRNNRKIEFLMHDVEFLCSLAKALDDSFSYPTTEINSVWQNICTLQFHDILPGSSIGQVYEEASQTYTELTKTLMDIREIALRVIGNQYSGDLLLINPSPLPRNDLVLIPDVSNGSFEIEGAPIPTQTTADGCLINPGTLPAYSITPIHVNQSLDANPPSPQTSPLVLENEVIRVTLDINGDIIGIFDKELNREILAPNGIANQFQIFEDRPLTYDAWDIDIYYDDKTFFAEPAVSIQWVEHGPLRQAITIKRKIARSTYAQHISISAGSKQIDFDTTIDWQERFKLLKVAFPVDILSPQATYEIQWGNVQRITHKNTSWDWARFETCAHKWVDLSEGDYGVSLLNDCKYGHDIQDNLIRLTLLRGPTVPDPKADLGEHEFKYSLLPHSGVWDERSQSAAYALNDPIILYKNQSSMIETPDQINTPIFNVNLPNIIIETIKQAEDGNGLIIRLYESHRKRGTALLQSCFPIGSAWMTNLLEENKEACVVQDGRLIFEFKPFEIKTIRILFRK